MPDLTFDRLQLSDQEYCGVDRRSFGRFIARGAALDEEYWVSYCPFLHSCDPVTSVYYKHLFREMFCA